MSDQPTIYLVCNAHLDPVWLWEWEEGAAEAISTFRVAADLCEQHDTFVFNHNEVILYEWVEEYEPALFERIQKLVAAGRWHIMGGWYLQPDCNMPSGESFVRQILSGRRYFSEKFGVRPTTAINFDPFGHTRGLVQIMAKSGYDCYFFCRPMPAYLDLPNHDFIWVGYDGSEIIGSRSIDWYNSPLGKAREKVEIRLPDLPESGFCYLLWGVGNHGGGPSRQDIEDLNTLIAETPQVDIRHATPEDYADRLRPLRDKLPRLERDLNPWAVGCYTSQIRLKQLHRQLENRLYATEKMASQATMAGCLQYPLDELRQAERELLVGEFHDILPGSSIQPVEEMSMRVFYHGLEILSRVRARAFFALASGQPAAADGEIPVLVHNPHPWPVETIVECEFQLQDQNWEPTFTDFTAYAGDQALPTQIEKEDSNLNLDWRKRIAFRATLAPSSMNRFDCRPTLRDAKPTPSLQPENSRLTFRNDRLLVEINTRTGLLDRYEIDGVSYLEPAAGRPVVVPDNADSWGMKRRGYQKAKWRFSLLSRAEANRVSGIPGAPVGAVRVIEDGPVRTVVEAVLGYEHSVAVLTWSLPRHGTEVGLQVRLIWNEKDKLLKLALPVKAPGPLLGQVAYGTDTLPGNGDEAVAQKWMGMQSGQDRLLTVINDGIYGADVMDGQLRLSLLRSPAYSGHPINDRPIVPEDRFQPRIDQGERLYRFWFNGGPKADRLAAIDREALQHNERPMALSFNPSGLGEAPAAGPVLSDDALLLTASKQAENGDGWIFRLFNPTDQTRTSQLTIPKANLEHDLTLGPYEIASYRLQDGALQQVDLMEEPVC